MARLHKTLTDYLVIALAPALIMTLIGSLLFFLLEVLYSGEFSGRLRVIFGLFAFASVLIARISIEDGRERAILFALPLAGVTWLALSALVKFSGPLAGYATGLNLGLVGLTLWCADRLTWDCTVIDDQADASGEGLLRTAGLEGAAGAEETQAGEPGCGRRGPEPPATGKRTWWERFVERRRRRHAPGVWVIYVSMVALPLFGIGQRFVSAADLDRRRFLFKLLCLFVASALGLLLTSSFLSLRRYLRQRKVEMPLGMASVWLIVGVTMIAVLLTVCAALPRPNAEYSLAHMVFQVSSPPDLKPSRFGTGREGTRPDETPAPTVPAPKPVDQPGGAASASEKGAGQGEAKADGSGGGDRGAKKEASGAGEKGKSPAGAKAAASGQGEKPAANSKGAPSAKTPGGGSGSRSESGSGSKPASPPPPPTSGSGTAPPPPSAPAPPKPAPPSFFQPVQMLNRLLQFIPQLLHGVYYLIVLLVVGWLLWRYRASVWPALCNFFEPFVNLWRHLFATTPERSSGETAAAAAPAPPPRFADFADPFQSGAVGQMTAEQLIVYSFQALEAWARDWGCERHPEQTPTEFAEQLAARNAAVGGAASELADRYSCLAYSGQPPPADRSPLQRLWQMLAATRPSHNPVAVDEGRIATTE